MKFNIINYKNGMSKIMIMDVFRTTGFLDLDAEVSFSPVFVRTTNVQRIVDTYVDRVTIIEEYTIEA